jgi:dolichol-phosphate mannosyltransferase
VRADETHTFYGSDTLSLDTAGLDHTRLHHVETVNPKAELMIVMPVFNEQASVRKVVNEWFQEIENWTENFVFLAIDDGSTDETPAILQRLQAQLGARLEVQKQTNAGHGQTCLRGYREACARGVPYVFQIDSDGQCDPQYFFKFWRERENFDALYGNRKAREDGWRRVLASFILRLTLLSATGINCVDANVPYRMMRTSHLPQILERIPPDFSLANIALAILLRRETSCRHGSVKIRFRERYGGEPSVRLSQFGAKARELTAQIRRLLA